MTKKKLTLTINKSVVIDAVKTDTHIKGTIDKSMDDNASRVAYNESAGDDEYHERKLDRTFVASSENLVAEISDMLSGNSEVSSDFSKAGLVVISVEVDARFNSSFADTLSRLCSSYIENKMLVLWWGTINQNQSAFYAQILADYLRSIRKCFNKIAPSAPVDESNREITILDTTGQLIDKE